MNIYASVQNAMTERRVRLSQICQTEVARLWPEYENRLAVAELRRELESRLAVAIKREMSEPFDLSVNDMGSGQWSLDANPLMTEAEKASFETTFRPAVAITFLP